MRVGGKVEGVTSDAKEQLANDIQRHQTAGLQALISYYVANSENQRDLADRQVKDAYNKALSAKKRQDRLDNIQAEHQASKQDLAKWLEDSLNK